MDGKKQLLQPKDFNDPFSAGQMVGMLVMLTFIENHPEMTVDAFERLKWTCAENAQAYLDKPTEDIFLFIDNLVKDMKP